MVQAARKKGVLRFRGGLAFQAHRLLYHSTPGSRVIKKKKCSLTSAQQRVPAEGSTRRRRTAREDAGREGNLSKVSPHVCLSLADALQMGGGELRVGAGLRFWVPGAGAGWMVEG
jgi:hypothetical protein